MISPPSNGKSVQYEFLEHTADVGLKAYGKGVEEIFEHAALGMFDLMTDLGRVEARGEMEIRLESPDLESLLVDWLSELLYVHETQNVFLCEFSVQLTGTVLRATARGEEVDPERHPLEVAVKAVTYHMIEVKPEEGYAVVIFDI